VFTGIVEEVATLRRREGGRFTFAAQLVTDGLELGDSIAHNGACLTVTGIDGAGYSVDVVDETLARTNLGSLEPGAGVNVERPVRLGGRLDGHLVQGHVDGVGVVLSAPPDLRVTLPAELARYVVAKGSVTVDGCSLTVVEAGETQFSVALIPHTMAVTTLGAKAPGDRVNLEVDVIAKYVERLLVHDLTTMAEARGA
jgi:riboflavin synthase